MNIKYLERRNVMIRRKLSVFDSVTLENEAQEQKNVSVEDEWLIEKHFEEGSI